MNDEALAKFAASLPEHLRFFFEPSSVPREIDPFLQFVREYVAKLRQHRTELLAHGVRVDECLEKFEPLVADLEATKAEVDAEDECLHEGADLSDPTYYLFRAAERALNQMTESGNCNPRIPEWIELTENFGMQLLKE